jgi:protein involved in polysaccharide export with SLBB domain
VSQVNSRKAYISGDGIGKPGVIPLAVPTKVSEAIAYAGGFRDFANKKKIHIVRGSKVYTYNDNDVAAGKHLEQDITLEPGDHIYVK